MDAHMKYMRKNVMTENEVSVMVKASSGGRKYQMSLSETNLLELKDISVKDMDQFNRIYGDYLIVGFIYGGEILFEYKYEAKSKEDKKKIETGMWYVMLCAFFTPNADAMVQMHFEKTFYQKVLSE